MLDFSIASLAFIFATLEFSSACEDFESAELTMDKAVADSSLACDDSFFAELAIEIALLELLFDIEISD